MRHEHSNGMSVFRIGPKEVKIDWNAETISTTKGGKPSTSEIGEMTLSDLLKLVK